MTMNIFEHAMKMETDGRDYYLEHAEIVGFCDQQLKRAQKYSDEHQVPAFASAKEMMERIGC